MRLQAARVPYIRGKDGESARVVQGHASWLVEYILVTRPRRVVTLIDINESINRVKKPRIWDVRIRDCVHPTMYQDC